MPIRRLTTELGGNAECTPIGGRRTAADRAAFWNSSLVRYLDFMDITMITGQSFHACDNLGAALAAAELAGATGKDFLTALAVGYQVQTRFAEAAPLQDKGFDHSTHLAFSIPAAISRALNLDAREGANAIAICGSAINTLWVIRTGRLSNWKGLASAQVSMACMHMTLLAARGITGPLGLLEGPQGWEFTVGDKIEIDWKKEPLDRFERSSIKRHNSEGHTQSVIECLLNMRAQHGIDAKDVYRVEVDVFKQAANITGGGEAGDRTLVRNKEQADHSLPYLCAVALLDGQVWPQQFTPERVLRPDVQDLLERVWVRQREDFNERYPNEMPCRVTVILKDQTELTAEAVDFPGFWRTKPLDWDAAMEKYERLAEPMAGATLTREIAQAVHELDSIDISELTPLLGRVGGTAASRRAAG
jgi:2-methylcitrate dehydratase